jgi:hypothetical protein
VLFVAHCARDALVLRAQTVPNRLGDSPCRSSLDEFVEGEIHDLEQPADALDEAIDVLVFYGRLSPVAALGLGFGAVPGCLAGPQRGELR